MLDASSPVSSNCVVYSPSKAADFVYPNKPSLLSAATESEGEEAADTAAMHVYEKYSRLQRELQVEFERELAVAVGIQQHKHACTVLDDGCHEREER